ncbi:unnamed protein product [Diatraea saccharalis]|uniref:Uncharacterized protein n=1 Tax=Diatraea saccharalis TaxID=40085 RepID=A0A9N9WLZ9_9NEOP|nr:unnamed protein product [Diatraea saccharalis]
MEYLRGHEARQTARRQTRQRRQRRAPPPARAQRAALRRAPRRAPAPHRAQPNGICFRYQFDFATLNTQAAPGGCKKNNFYFRLFNIIKILQLSM